MRSDGLLGLIEITAERAMNLMRAIAAPSLDRSQDEIGLLLEGVGAAGFDCIESAFRRANDAAIRTRPGDD